MTQKPTHPRKKHDPHNIMTAMTVVIVAGMLIGGGLLTYYDEWAQNNAGLVLLLICLFGGTAPTISNAIARRINPHPPSKEDENHSH